MRVCVQTLHLPTVRLEQGWQLCESSFVISDWSLATFCTIKNQDQAAGIWQTNRQADNGQLGVRGCSTMCLLRNEIHLPRLCFWNKGIQKYLITNVFSWGNLLSSRESWTHVRYIDRCMYISGFAPSLFTFDGKEWQHSLRKHTWPHNDPVSERKLLMYNLESSLLILVFGNVITIR